MKILRNMISTQIESNLTPAEKNIDRNFNQAFESIFYDPALNNSTVVKIQAKIS